MVVKWELTPVCRPWGFQQCPGFIPGNGSEADEFGMQTWPNANINGLRQILNSGQTFWIQSNSSWTGWIYEPLTTKGSIKKKELYLHHAIPYHTLPHHMSVEGNGGTTTIVTAAVSVTSMGNISSKWQSQHKRANVENSLLENPLCLSTWNQVVQDLSYFIQCCVDDQSPPSH